MVCSIDGCNKNIAFKSRAICQMHYFRFMRNATYDILTKEQKKKMPMRGRKRTQNAKGYQMIYEPEHPLAMGNGYVYEHRKIVYAKFGDALPPCEMCGKELIWRSVHIDHKNNDVTDNDILNLRPLCRACNTFRGHSPSSMSKNVLTIGGVSRSPAAWSRVEGVNVSGATITRRLRMGATHYDCVYGEKATHKLSYPNKAPKRTDTKRK